MNSRERSVSLHPGQHRAGHEVEPLLPETGLFRVLAIWTRTAVRHWTSDLVIWPETALPFVFMATDRKLTEDFLAFQRPMNAYLLFGSILGKQAEGRRHLRRASSSTFTKQRRAPDAGWKSIVYI
ncbi:MAG: hypothetical protein MZU79_03170 [Anaerotruncus sp.]|nr:hypothetical protein [Anaerotruncus sp.]